MSSYVVDGETFHDDTILENPIHIGQKIVPPMVNSLKEVAPKGVPNIELTLIACCIHAGIDYLDLEDKDTLMEKAIMPRYISGCLALQREVLSRDILSTEEVWTMLVKAGLVSKEAGIGSRLEHIMKEKVPMSPCTEPEYSRERTRPLPKTGGPLLKRGLAIIGSSPYGVNAYGLGLLERTMALCEKGDPLLEQKWLLDACLKLDTSATFYPEYMVDDRLRMHLATTQGPGISGDVGLCCVEFKEVGMEYDPNEAFHLLKYELMNELGKFADWKECRTAIKGAITLQEKWVQAERMDEDSKVKKPLVFAATARLFTDIALYRQDPSRVKPYCGYLFGMDLKCSGMQIGAILTNDHALLMACGFSRNKVADAYQRAIDILTKVGYHGLYRDIIKTAHMAGGFGQTWLGLCNSKEVDEELWPIVHGEDSVEVSPDTGLVTHTIDEDSARRFYKFLGKSFGKVKGLMTICKERVYDFKNEKSLISHPPTLINQEGSEVTVRYYLRENICGEVLGVGIDRPDVHVTLECGYSLRLKKMTINTKDHDLPKYGRNGVVDVTHTTDSVEARLVAVDLAMKGVRHIILVHDNYKVDINSVHLLPSSIKWAVRTLFGQEAVAMKNGYIGATDLLPGGVDITRNWLNSIQEVLIDQATPELKTSQYFKVSGENKYVSHLIDTLRDLRKTEFLDLIEALEHPAHRIEGQNSYYAS